MKRILILDDNAESRKSLAQQLTAEGYEILESVDGLESLDIIAVEHPDLVIAQVLSPRLDGFTFCHLMKSNPSTASIPIVLLSSNKPTPEDEAFALSVGGEDLLVTPVDRDTLVALVGRLLLRSEVLPLAVRNEVDYLRGYVVRLRNQIREHNAEIKKAESQAAHTNSEVARARSKWLANEREELNRQLHRARARLDELQAERVLPHPSLHFDADVSNDIHTMLTTIMRSSDLLLSGAHGALPEPQAERLLVIREGSRRVLDVLNALRAPEPASVAV